MDSAVSPELLVVEDDEAARSELAELFSAAGIGTVAAADGIEALVLSERYPSIRVVVTDVSMPRMDGPSFVAEFRRLGNRTSMPRFIFISARQIFTDAVMALRLRAWDFLPKPVPPKLLLEQVRKALAEDGEETWGGGAPAPASESSYRDAVKSLLLVRKTLERYVHADLFSDPCWDMLLELYSASLDGKQAYLTGLCFAAGVPLTTATRRLEDLVSAGLVSKSFDPVDRRRVIVNLTPEGRSRLERFCQIMNEQQHRRSA